MWALLPAAPDGWKLVLSSFNPLYASLETGQSIKFITWLRRPRAGERESLAASAAGVCSRLPGWTPGEASQAHSLTTRGLTIRRGYSIETS